MEGEGKNAPSRHEALPTIREEDDSVVMELSTTTADDLLDETPTVAAAPSKKTAAHNVGKSSSHKRRRRQRMLKDGRQERQRQEALAALRGRVLSSDGEEVSHGDPEGFHPSTTPTTWTTSDALRSSCASTMSGRSSQEQRQVRQRIIDRIRFGTIRITTKKKKWS